MSPDSGLLNYLACPVCRAALQTAAADCMRCPAEGLLYRRIEGVWHMLRPERAAYFAQFMQEYETIRRAEQRGSAESAYYRALPYSDITERWSADWAIRARSFDTLISQVVTPLENLRRDSLRVLDLGAGSGWLSNRLALRGHDVGAVDLHINTFDGLGAHIHYNGKFLPIQADFDALPFIDNVAHLVIYNASLHYSEDISQTLAEGLRVLSADGLIVVVDSPLYRSSSSGQQMVQEREQTFTHRFGFASNTLHSESYLTYDRLDALARSLNLRWTRHTPRFGWRFHLRRWRTRLRAGREAAAFPIIVGQRA